MQLKLSFVAGLIASSAFAIAALVNKEERGINIDIAKRSNLKIAGTDQIDWSKVNAHMSSLRAKYSKNLANFEKNTGTVHPLKRDLPAELKKRATGSVALTEQEGGSLWTGTMAYGTPAQSFSFDFDTGSSDTLVSKGTFKPSASSTSRTNGDQFSCAYGDGTTAKGTIYTDTVHIGGLSATNTAIGASTTTLFVPSKGSSGIAGMALPQIADFDSKYLPYFYRLKQAGAVTSGKFQFDLRTSGSSLFLGGTDSAKYSSTPVYVNIDPNQGFWQVPASVNGQRIDSIVDTGTTIIVAPPSQAQTFFQTLGLPTFQRDGSIYAYYNCNSPPKVTFRYGSYTKTLSAATTSLGTINSGKCVMTVAGSDLGLNAWVTGDSFLQNVVAIFDTDNNSVGFANKA